MPDDPRRKLVVDYAYLFIKTFYTWGGDDPSGMDCSGITIEDLKSVGILPRKYDNTASGLFYHPDFKPVELKDVRPGDLAFWFGSKSTKIVHVEIVVCVNPLLSIGASGGGSKTLTVKDAIKHNAFVKRRLVNSRPYLAGFRNPFND